MHKITGISTNQLNLRKGIIMKRSKLTRIISALLVVVALFAMPLSVYATDMTNYGNAYDVDDDGNEIKTITSIQANIHFDVDYFSSVRGTGYFTYTSLGDRVTELDIPILMTGEGDNIELTRTETAYSQPINVGYRTRALTFYEEDMITEISGEYWFYSIDLQRYIAVENTYLNVADHS